MSPGLDIKAALSDNVLGKVGHCSLWKLRDRERVEHLADPPQSSSCASTCCLPIITDDLYDVGIAWRAIRFDTRCCLLCPWTHCAHVVLNALCLYQFPSSTLWVLGLSPGRRAWEADAFTCWGILLVPVSTYGFKNRLWHTLIQFGTFHLLFESASLYLTISLKNMVFK